MDEKEKEIKKLKAELMQKNKLIQKKEIKIALQFKEIKENKIEMAKRDEENKIEMAKRDEENKIEMAKRDKKIERLMNLLKIHNIDFSESVNDENSGKVKAEESQTSNIKNCEHANNEGTSGIINVRNSEDINVEKCSDNPNFENSKNQNEGKK